MHSLTAGGPMHGAVQTAVSGIVECDLALYAHCSPASVPGRPRQRALHLVDRLRPARRGKPRRHASICRHRRQCRNTCICKARLLVAAQG